MEKVLELIKKYNRIILFGHVRPDGDCIGSQYGMYYLIKDSFPINPTNSLDSPDIYTSFFGKLSLIK